MVKGADPKKNSFDKPGQKAYNCFYKLDMGRKMFAIGDKVRACIESIGRIGTIDGVNTIPGTKATSYMVMFPFMGDCIELSEDELTPYTHEHISNSFSRKTNETRQFGTGNN